MRVALQETDGIRDTFVGTVARYGGKGRGKYTILITDVHRKSDGEYITDHLWFNLTKGFKSLRLDPGEKVQFDARSKPYEKGYKGRKKTINKPVRTDYKLSHPSKVCRVK